MRFKLRATKNESAGASTEMLFEPQRYAVTRFHIGLNQIQRVWNVQTATLLGEEGNKVKNVDFTAIERTA
jgi:hypothetical protein